MGTTSPKNLTWRIVKDELGLNEITMVLPFERLDGEPEMLLETGVKFSGTEYHTPEISWTSSDLLLFTTLCGISTRENTVVKLEIDFADPSTIEMINIVASARFSDEVDLSHLDMSPGFQHEMKHFELGEVVSINTDQGFKLAVVVDFTHADLRCVILEPFFVPNSQEFLSIHDVIRIPRLGVLPAEFGDTLVNETDILH